jgi:hypothetical protein
MSPEIGRELKVSELVPRTVVVLERPDSFAASIWVVMVQPEYVVFRAGAISLDFIAKRTGPDLEQITDDTGRQLHVHEYLGVV